MLNKSNELATWIYALHRTLIEDGYDADGLMKRANFDFDVVTSTSEYIAKDTVNLIWAEVERTTGDDAYCLRTIPFVSDAYLNAIVIMVQACESIEHALQSLSKYFQLVDGTSKISVNVNDNLCISVANKYPDFPAAKQDIDLIFGLISKHVPMLLVDGVKPLSVCFTRSQPDNVAAYQEYFSCPVLFEQSKNAIEFPLRIPFQMIPSANPSLSNHIEEYLSNRLLNLVGGDFAVNVKNEVIQLLPSGTPKLRDVAARLNISERTLQRKLQKHDICFTALLNSTRLELAREYLKEPSKTIQETAYELGFSESGNFIRFFKQQTGQTPNAFVKAITS